jgi:hypothetical protein
VEIGLATSGTGVALHISLRLLPGNREHKHVMAWETTMKRVLIGCSTALSVMLTGSAVAHHSGAMFDREKTMVLVGTVKEFKWSNPHAWLEVNVPNATGGTDVWGVEMNSPNNMVRQGWRASSLKPGEKVKVTVRPMRDGSKGGSFMSVEKADGTVLGNPPSTIGTPAPAAAEKPAEKKEYQ